jgi:D-glycero-D-manno-heptose 1,7-bisphosphate phosphatase
MSRAVFLDRDGTLIREKGFICHFQEAEVFPFSPDALKIMNTSGFRVIVITNQSAIGRGICTESQVKILHSDLADYFAREGAVIDAFYYSPFLPDAPVPEFRRIDESRKPAPGMILQAARDFGIELSQSYMIGDSTRDIQAGKRAGCQTVLVLTGNGQKALKELGDMNLEPDWVGENLLAAISDIRLRDPGFSG